MLYRTSPLGTVPAGWMCMECMEVKEPELAKNLKGEDDFDVLKDIEDALKLPYVEHRSDK
jgi:hypothetical protein